MIGFTEISTVEASGIVAELAKLHGIDSDCVLVEHCGDGKMTISLANEVIDWPHARASYLADGVPEYRRINLTATRTRRSSKEVEPEVTEPTLPTVSKSSRNRAVTTTEAA